MKPIVAPFVSKICLALRDLVGMMRKGIIYSAAVYVKTLAEMLHTDARAFDMPARITDSPRGIPFERLILKL